MNEREFCYWLQGLMEVGNVSTLNEVQVQQIKDHLNLVFNKETPIYIKDIKWDVQKQCWTKPEPLDCTTASDEVCEKQTIVPPSNFNLSKCTNWGTTEGIPSWSEFPPPASC